LVAKGEHAAEIHFDEPAEEVVHAKWERVFDLIAEDGAGSIGPKNVLVAPVGKRALFLDVGKEAVVLVFSVDGNPGFVERPEEKAELDACAGVQAAGAGNDLHLLPGREEELEDIRAFMEGEEGFDGGGKTGFMNEVAHGGCKLSLL
jgi:hypothetical protein